jgi:hypothetical protein
MDYEKINAALSNLQTNPAAIRTVFGASSHQYKTNPRLEQEEAQRFEQAHNIELPTDYRGFLTGVGNGGAGPFYGLFSLGHWDGEAVAALSDPFPFTAAWNDRTDKKYQQATPGAFPICNMGGGQRLWLVLSGPERGNIWRDYRADELGWFPDEEPNSPRITFAQWYQTWMDQISHR